MADETGVGDLIIIKRRSGGELETPKGGVWKIAFADFMTAMMCFFLVMWLINAANEDTRQAVASYFNPVRLAELNKKGLQDPKVAPADQPEQGKPTSGEPTPGNAAPKGSAEIPHDALFKDPYEVLAKIVGDSPPIETADGGADLSVAAAGPFRDPFDPEFSREEPGTGFGGTAATQSAADGGEPGAASTGKGEAPLDGPLRLSLPPAEPAPDAPGTAQMSALEAAEAIPAPKPSSEKPVSPEAAKEAAEVARAQLEAELAEAVKAETSGDQSPGVTVEETGEGVMISLTDDADFGMFSIGSAQPQPQMVRIMERIAAILKSRSGSIIVRGHTDARPFRTAAYDNWRLSTDRAQMAYYMLARGGLDEQRVEAIEGYADRKLKTPGDPEGAQNRRIEILLREVDQ